MSFQDNLAKMPSIAHLQGLDIYNEEGELIHHIPAVPGKLGSLSVYHYLELEFNKRLDSTAAQCGLQLFAEHVADAQVNPGKHPNVELLERICREALVLHLQAIPK